MRSYLVKTVIYRNLFDNSNIFEIVYDRMTGSISATRLPDRLATPICLDDRIIHELKSASL